MWHSGERYKASIDGSIFYSRDSDFPEAQGKVWLTDGGHNDRIINGRGVGGSASLGMC